MEKLIKLQYNEKSDMEIFMRNYNKDSMERRSKESYYKVRLENLEGYWKVFSRRHRDIIALATEEIKETERYFVDEIHSTMEEFYVDAYTKMMSEFRRDHPIKEIETLKDEKGMTQVIQIRSKQDEIKLPRISIPMFSGDYVAWTPFYDMFKSLVHNNEHLSSVQKLQYLKAHLSGEAQTLLSNTPITDANYDLAWSTLVRRYDNKRILVKAQLDMLFNQPMVNQESAKGVKSLLDKTSECLAALKNLNVNTASWDPIIVNFLSKRLPYETIETWEQSLCTKVELPTWEELKQFLETRFRTLEAINANKRRIVPKETKGVMYEERSGNRNQAFHLATISSCQLCKEAHAIRQCPKYLGLDHQGKLDLIKSQGLCMNCLGKGHFIAKCPSNLKCYICKKPHHTTLHKERNSVQIQRKQNQNHSPQQSFMEEPGVVTQPTTQSFVVNQSSKSKGILLATALVTIISPQGQTEVCRALIDPGSQASFVTENTVQSLRLPRKAVNIEVSGLGSISTERVKSRASIILSTKDSTMKSIRVEAFIVTKITNGLPSQHLARTKWTHLEGLPLADPTFDRPGRIDILLGADVYPLIIAEGLRKGPPGTPIGQHTIFGWIISGQASQQSIQTKLLENFHVNVNENLKLFWELEELPVTAHLSNEDQRCEQHFIENHIRRDDKRYQVRLPFESKQVQLGSSRNMAIIRMIQLEKRLSQDAYLKEEYTNCIKEYLDLNHMEPTSTKETDFLKYDEHGNSYYNCTYLPHHAVVKLSSTSTKVRVVFDASQRTSNGKSLNDVLLKGPTIQESLFSILMRWRKYEIAFMADVHKMYRQIRIHPDDSDYQRIIWRDSPDKPFCDYKLTTVTFGTKSAPYLAIRAMHQLAKDEQHNYPVAVEAVLNDFYVDDLISGGNSIEEATRKQCQIRSLLESGGLELRKWASNNELLLQAIPEEFREVNLPLSVDADTIKALGILWSPRDDYLSYKIEIEDTLQTWTKQTILSEISKLFDPLGWLAPVTVLAKHLIQTLWLAGIQWDDEIPRDIEEKWKCYRQGLPSLQYIQIPRWIRTGSTSTIVDLHGFCDASIKAYAAVVYVRVEQVNGEVDVQLISAKTKVAPIKTISLPKLELCGANLLAKLVAQVKKDMQLNIQDVYCWTDSTIVLAWLRKHPSHWETFVSNRVSNIHQLLEECSWNHVPTETNPADCASRGISPERLKNYVLWWKGPQWLRGAKDTWPRKRDDIETTVGLHKRTITLHVQIMDDSHELLERFSSFSRLIRVTAYCQRWIGNVRSPLQNQKLKYLTSEELQSGLTFWIRTVQQKEFSSEIKALQIQKQIARNSRLIKLHPFLSNDKLIRVGGRLQNSSLSYAEQHPIILPEKSHLTKLIIDDYHKKSMHGGVQLMLSLLRRKFWILNARNAIRSHIHQCISCFRQTAQTRTQLMANLPTYRVQPARPFAHSGVDYCGPFDVKSSKGKGIRSYKGYIAVFICMVTKAMHLEIVSDLSTPGFIATFRRFVSRRGLCTDIYSDCGSNFIGANAILTRYKFTQVQQHEHEIAKAIENLGIKWHFIPPSSPHFGGLWESGVKSVKTHLKRTMGNTLLTYEELSTLLTQIEASLNSRPLTEMTQDPQDITALTPGHFLIGGPLLMPPEPSLLDENVNHLDRYKHIQKLTQSFWARWSKEYLHRLQQRPKWLTQQPNLKENELVLVKDDRLPPAHWLLGRIISTHPGRDNLTRVVTIKTQYNVIKRPITKVCPLPIMYSNQTTPNLKEY